MTVYTNCADHGSDAARDMEFGGAGTIIGLTEVQTGPSTYTAIGHCRVRIYDQKGGGLVREVWSDLAGHYTVPLINPRVEYFAVAFDPAGLYDATATRNLQVTP
jgi:hypothetical protein